MEERVKFTTQREVLLKGIQNVQSVINTKSALPILANILIDAMDDSIILTTTDLDIGIISTLPLKPNMTGSITIPAKKFFDIIKELPEGEVTLLLKKNNLVHIETLNCLFKIMGIPKDEYPQLPEFKNKDTLVLPQKKLKEMFSMTSFAVSHDETRYVLNGILFIIKPAYLRLVATDGRRLAVAEFKTQLPKALERKFIIPTKTISELARLLQDEGDIKIFLGETQVAFDLGATKIVSRLIEGEFPNYEQVIPKEHKDKLGVSKEKFLAALRRVALFTNQDSMAVRIDLGKDKIVLSKSTPYIGEVREELEADYKGKEFSVGFNPAYIIDLLKNLREETVSFELTDPEKPGTIRSGDEYVYVVLPMQLADRV